MELLFKGKTAIVTGAGQGIGFEICKQLVLQGASVLLNDKDEALVHKAADQLSGGPGMCRGLAGDASDLGFISQMVEEAVRHFGELHIVIANAGITLFGDFFEYPLEKFQRVVDLNLRGSFFLTQAAARYMRDNQIEGSILLMSSVTGHQAHDKLGAYGMSKAALEMLAKTLVFELSPYKITINTVAPGATLTERTSSNPEYEKVWSRITPMGRPAHPEDIAHAALFLVSPHARHITGQNIIVDGGWTCISPPPHLND